MVEKNNTYMTFPYDFQINYIKSSCDIKITPTNTPTNTISDKSRPNNDGYQLRKKKTYTPENFRPYRYTKYSRGDTISGGGQQSRR
jgi:hypothetical protein